MAPLPTLTCAIIGRRIILGPSKCSLGFARATHTSPHMRGMPRNVAGQEKTEKSKFSPKRSRDTSSAHIAAKQCQAGAAGGLGKALNTSTSLCNSPKDSHVSMYDKGNTCSLSSVMQATVPQPFKTRGSVDRSGHLSMPGGQWEQNDKYVSADLHDHHYRKASIQSKKKTSSASTNKVSDAATTYEVPKSKTPIIDAQAGLSSDNGNSMGHRHHTQTLSLYCQQIRSFGNLCLHTNANCHLPHLYHLTHSPKEFSSSQNTVNYLKLQSNSSNYSTSSSGDPSEPKNMSSRQKLQRAVKEYGVTVIVFHVTISLSSLGLCYLLVSSGIDVSGIMQFLGVDLAAKSDISTVVSEGSIVENTFIDSLPMITDAEVEAAADTIGTNNASVGEKEASVAEGASNTAGSVVTGVSTFVIAYAIHKVFAPARIATTLTATPFIVRTLRARGILQPPKTIK